MALTFCAGLKERGFRIPDAIGVIGQGDQPFAAHLSPPLSTVARDHDALADKVAAFFEDASGRAGKLVLPTRFKSRHSTLGKQAR